MNPGLDDIAEARRRQLVARGREIAALIEQGQSLTPALRDELADIERWLKNYVEAMQRENEACKSFMRWAQSLPDVRPDTPIQEVLEIAAKRGDDTYQLIGGRVIHKSQIAKIN